MSGTSKPISVEDQLETARRQIDDLERELSEARQALDQKSRDVDLIQQTMSDLHEAIETIDSGFAMFDRNDHLVFCNQRYYETFPKLSDAGVIRPGVSFEEIVRTGAERGYVEAAVGRVDDYVRERMEKHRDPGEPYEYFQGRGNWIRTEERRTPGGAYVGTRADITNFKTIEQELAKLLDQQKAHLRAFAEYAPMSFMVKDRQGRYEYVNLHFEQLFDVKEADIIGKTVAEILPNEETALMAEHEEEVWNTGLASSTELDVVAAGGVVKRLEIRKFPIYGADGQMAALGGINLDVTDIKNTRDDMIVARDQAEAGNRAKSEFLASMNHELRTPLTSSLGSLGLLNSLVSDTLPEEARELLDIALRNNEALLRLVNELLDYEKILSGTLIIKTQMHDIHALTETVVGELQGYAQTQSVNFVYNSQDVQHYANVQEHRFAQILNNLLSNAAKFSEPGSDVDVSITSKEGRVFVNVQDHGPGIPEDFKAKLYDQFTQVDSSSTRQHRGTGLGLAISKALAEGMGGDLGFETEMGVGSVFHVSFPEVSKPNSSSS